MKMFRAAILVVGIISFCLGLETEVVVLRAVRGRDARLPCGQGKVFLDGPDSYILWLKNDREFLYRFPSADSERRSVNRDRVFGTSCDASACYDDTSLLLKRVGEQDGGTYRCRVHYQASPSVDYVIDVKLVESTGMPRIYNENGEEIKSSSIGPLSLGSELTLICEVNDEQPDTLVYWRRNGGVIERAHTSRPGILRAELTIFNMTRAELDAHYECLATNADVTEPLTASVVIRMYLPPLSVEIRLNNNLDFEAGQPRVVDCVVVGCVPPPTVTWHLGGSLLRPTVHKELHDGNYTVSSLTLAPSLRDSEHDLICRAHNSHLPTTVFEDKVALNVGYRPICLNSHEETVGVIDRDAETVTCIVEASPEPLQFSWIFADSRTLYTSVKKIPGHHHRYSSTLTWLPREKDLGLLLCRATNSFGEQKRPCTFIVTPGTPPQTPECVVLRSYPSTLKVQCKKGWDGGRPQLIHLEVLDDRGSLIRNLSDTAGHFSISHIEDDRNFTIVVYSSTVRGVSKAKSMQLMTNTPLMASVTETAPQPNWARWLEVSTYILAIIVGIITSVLCFLAIRRRNSEEDQNPDLVPRSDGSFHREPDFTRDERPLGTTNITVNQLASCPNGRDITTATRHADRLVFSDMPHLQFYHRHDVAISIQPRPRRPATY